MNRGRCRFTVTALREAPASCSKACQVIEVEMKGHGMEERGDPEGDEAEPCSLGKANRLPRITTAPDLMASGRGRGKACREERQEEGETGKAKVHCILKIDIVDRGPGRPDFFIEGQDVS